jgi:aarF domain-containing kinase
MTPDLVRALRALPADARRELWPGDELAEISREIAARPFPAGRWRRAWVAGTLPAVLAGGWIASWLRSGFVPSSERERLRHDAQLAAALRVFRAMAYLRGAAAKLGQLLATHPDLVPEHCAELFARLHFQAPPMHFALVREVLERELGAPPELVFAELETEPRAAASIGQVHRGRLPSGEVVAVKVQYPGIGKAIRTDFAALGALLSTLRLSADWRNFREQFEDLRRMVQRETDYLAEADQQERARSLFSAEDGVVVPRVHRGYTTRKVLTTGWLDGSHVDPWLATRPPQEDRDRRGTQLFLASFRLYYSGRRCYTDPHPGNFLFLDDGRLGLLDFGSIREFDGPESRYLDEMEQISSGDRGLWRRLAALAADLPPSRLDETERIEHLVEVSRWLWEPLGRTEPFDFGDRAFLQRGIDLYTRALERGYLRSLPVNTWLTRCYLGLRSLAWRIGARVDCRRLHQDETARAAAPGERSDR